MHRRLEGESQEAEEWRMEKREKRNPTERHNYCNCT
jgi:hypothetical protein